MTIACGTDFSENAGAAARAAGAITARLAVPLSLVHVVDASLARNAVEQLRARLVAQAGDLRRKFGIEVEPRIESGEADERLVEFAASLHARLLVVSALGERKQHRWLLGSVAERVVQAASMPVLVVRDGGSIEAWARGERALRVMVGVEPTPSSRAALDWADALHAIGPRELLVVQIAWPAAEQHRIGISSPVPLDHLRPEVEQGLVRALEQWAGEPTPSAGRSFVVRPGWGRVDGHLTQLAAECEADLLVVGTHQRAGIARFWQGSVSRGVLHGAAMSVACVPPCGAADEHALGTP